MRASRSTPAFAVGVATFLTLLHANSDVASAQAVVSFAATALIQTSGAVPAATNDVAPGCTVPTSKTGHHTFYVDPVRGNMSGDGSAAHPWHTLAEVFNVQSHLLANAPDTWVQGVGIVKAGPNAPIKSGDTILLMSGNHGSPSLQGYFGDPKNTLYGYNNSDFITVAAAPGQTPVVTSLSLLGAAKWLFQGIVFQSLQNVPSNKGKPFSGANIAASGVTDYYLAYLDGPSSDIIFNANVFQSQADTSSWTTGDWLFKRASGVLAQAGNCIAVTNNLLQNIGFGIETANETNVLIKNNTINNFSDDGIDYGSSNLIIDSNRITNSIEDNDGFHRDAMQGSPGRSGTASNIQITNNYVNNQTQKLVAIGQLQGIDAFDGAWQNLLVENNVVITNTYHGITYYGVNNIRIINNTVIGAYSDAANSINTWIDVNPSKSGTASQNVIVRNNLAAQFIVTAASATFDHNLIVTLNPYVVKNYPYNSGVPSGLLASSVFVAANTKALTFDPRLLNNTPAVNGGLNTLAPSTDIRGLLRGKSASTSIGALISGGSAIALQSNSLSQKAAAATLSAGLGTLTGSSASSAVDATH